MAINPFSLLASASRPLQRVRGAGRGEGTRTAGQGGWHGDARRCGSASVTTAAVERATLADLFSRVGPEAPTLCEGWRTRDLLVHLVVREYRPDAALGMFAPALAGRLAAVTREYEQRDFEELVRLYRQGPPRYNPMRLADRFVNLAENFVHHEDVLRAGEAGEGSGTARRGTTTSVRPDSGDGARAERGPAHRLGAVARDDLWAVVRQVAGMFLRRSRVPVVLERTDCPEGSTAGVCRVGKVTSDAQAHVVVRGTAPEILLWLYGRDKVADVTVDCVAGAVPEDVVVQAL